MKATGIVRRLDDLGRIVIPKELRRMLHLSENDPLEIYLEDGNLILKRYNPLGINKDALNVAVMVLSEVGFTQYAIYDTCSKLAGSSAFPRLIPEEIRLVCDINVSCEWIEMDLPGGMPANHVECRHVDVAPIRTNGDLLGYIVCDANEIPQALKDAKDASLVKRLQLLQVAKMLSHLCALE